MKSYCITLYMDGFYTSRAFQRYQEHPNRSSYDKFMVLRSWSKNRGLQQRRDVENQRLDVAETLLDDVATLLHDVATFGVGFGWIFSPFLAHNGGFLSSNPKETRGEAARARRRGLCPHFGTKEEVGTCF